MEPNPKNIIKQSHHERHQLCITRPSYRQGKKLTAVKVYTINDESQHLLIRGVPALNLYKELKHLCLRYGDIKVVHQVKDYAEDEEPFTEVYHVLYAKIQSARFAKHIIDDKSFFGGVLHVCYAPELETIAETRHKLDERKHEVLKRLRQYETADSKKSEHIEPIPGTSGISYQSNTSSGQSYKYSDSTSGNRGIKNSSAHSSSYVDYPSYLADQPLPHEPQCTSTASSPQLHTYRQSSQSYRSSPVPIHNPKPLSEAGIIAKEFIPRQAPKPKIGPELNSSTSLHSSSVQPKEHITVKRNVSKTNLFIPPQVKRIKFNKP